MYIYSADKIFILSQPVCLSTSLFVSLIFSSSKSRVRSCNQKDTVTWIVSRYFCAKLNLLFSPKNSRQRVAYKSEHFFILDEIQNLRICKNICISSEFLLYPWNTIQKFVALNRTLVHFSSSSVGKIFSRILSIYHYLFWKSTGISAFFSMVNFFFQ